MSYDVAVEALRCRVDGKIRYRCGEMLARHTTFRIGGEATLALFPRNEGETLFALSETQKCGVPLFVIGGGSNLLAPDAGYDGAVLFTGDMNGISVSPLENGDAYVTAESGVSLSALAKTAFRYGLTGAEFLYGIPGTVGGAVVMNAGAYGGEIAQILVSSHFVDRETPSAVSERTLSEHRYGYRTSVYLAHPSEIVLSAVFYLKKGDPTEIEREMRRLIEQRREKQPLEFPSAGSFFQRPIGTFAGKLIEDCGLKGMRVGGAEVSVKHAGFIINRGGATEADVRALAARVRETVRRETGYCLACEVRTMGGEPI